MKATEPDDRTLMTALRAVAEDDATLSASSDVERRLLAEVHAIARMRRLRMRILPLAAAAVLVVAVGLPAWYASRQRADVANRTTVSDGGAVPTREEATEFFPLPYSEVPAPGGYVVRMQVPRTALTSFGVTQFEPAEERTPTVLADVLVGGDGVARAVRFVRVVRSNQ